MRYHLSSLRALQEADFDDIIDVRSPAEFAEDHLPGAVNLPVLDNKERATVGTLYKQISPFEARQRGAAMIARNAAHHIETHFMGKSGGYRPLVYCWRGGMRSGALATILEQIGWRVAVLDEGYKAYRRAVVDLLHPATSAPGALPWSFILLDGNTGTAKTALLHKLAARGIQTLDLEGLAAHRGSLFGATAHAQPSQKAFEGGIAQILTGFDVGLPVLVEAESSRIGRLSLPKALWAAMRAAPRLRLVSEPEARARYLVKAYGDIASDAQALCELVNRLRPYQPARRIKAWLDMAAQGDVESLTRELIEFHYDPKYGRQRSGSGHKVLEIVRLSDLGEPDLARATDHIFDRVTAMV